MQVFGLAAKNKAKTSSVAKKCRYRKRQKHNVFTYMDAGKQLESRFGFVAVEMSQIANSKGREKGIFRCAVGASYGQRRQSCIDGICC